MRYSDEDLRRMKTRRRELVAEYGDKGQHHPMGRMIGGLNPAAQELYRLRGQIAEAESERRAPSSVLTPLPGSKSGYGLKFDIEYQGRRGKLGTDNFGRWYIIAGEGSQADVVASDFKTKGEAAKAFARLSKIHSSGTASHHATKKKSPVQLQREIDEVLARPGRSHSTRREDTPVPKERQLTAERDVLRAIKGTRQPDTSTLMAWPPAMQAAYTRLERAGYVRTRQDQRKWPRIEVTSVGVQHLRTIDDVLAHEAMNRRAIEDVLESKAARLEDD